MKQFILILQLTLFSLLAFSQENSSVKNNKHFLGVGASSTSGMGITYRMWHHDKIGFQISSLPFINRVRKKVYVNSSVSYLFLLRKADRTKFYLYNSYQFIYKEKYYEWSHYTRKTSDFNIGLGIGLQSSQNNFSIAIQFGYGAYSINTRLPVLSLAGGAFLFYYF